MQQGAYLKVRKLDVCQHLAVCAQRGQEVGQTLWEVLNTTQHNIATTHLKRRQPQLADAFHNSHLQQAGKPKVLKGWEFSQLSFSLKSELLKEQQGARLGRTGRQQKKSGRDRGTLRKRSKKSRDRQIAMETENGVAIEISCNFWSSHSAVWFIMFFQFWTAKLCWVLTVHRCICRQDSFFMFVSYHCTSFSAVFSGSAKSPVVFKCSIVLIREAWLDAKVEGSSRSVIMWWRVTGPRLSVNVHRPSRVVFGQGGGCTSFRSDFPRTTWDFWRSPVAAKAWI